MTISTNVLKHLDEAIERQMDAEDIPGLALAITDRDGLLDQRTYGVHSIEAQAQLSPDHRFEYGSIGKSFTCILLLQLAEDGLLDLHAPLAEYLPWFEIQSTFAPITPHHLMTHTAGIITGTDFPADPRYEVWALRETRAVNPPGEHFHYSNVGYKALGLLLERITGKSYPSLVQEQILDPLDMTSTDPEITHATRHCLATGYEHRFDDRPWRRDHGHVPATWLETNTADGCIAGTAADLARYLRMLMNRGVGQRRRVLSESAFDQMTTPHARLPEARLAPERTESGGYGYGLYSYVQDGCQHIGHGGGMVGYHTHMLADLTTGYGVTVLINGPGHCLPVAEFALHALRSNARGDVLPSASEPAPLAGEALRAYAGRYIGVEDEIQVAGEDGRLWMSWNGQRVNLEPRGGDAFLVDHPAFELFLLQFDRDDDGAVVAASHGSKRWRAAGRPDQATNCPAEWRAFPGHYRSHNPWLGNFRVILRNGSLIFVSPDGYEQAVTPREDGVFRVGDAQSPEFIRFDTIVDGEAWRANYSGCDYYRFFTP